MIFTKKIIQLSKNDRKIAGGKSIYLGEIMKMGILVPKGFVVLAPAFDKFLEQNNLDKKIKKLLRKINSDNKQSINKISKEIDNLIIKTAVPKDMAAQIGKEFLWLKKNYVAVRSSAIFEDSSTSSWAGELESYLNTTKINLLNNLKKCWASIFGPKAISYKFNNVLNKNNFSVAVIVQEMIQSEISGVCFTVHPVAVDYNKMVIEAGSGLGEIITEGIVTPDTYIVDKKNKLISDKHINQQKQKMTDAQILKLSEICRKIEKHYKAPQDIEWAFAKNKFYILQSRPITTL